MHAWIPVGSKYLCRCYPDEGDFVNPMLMKVRAYCMPAFLLAFSGLWRGCRVREGVE